MTLGFKDWPNGLVVAECVRRSLENGVCGISLSAGVDVLGLAYRDIGTVSVFQCILHLALTGDIGFSCISIDVETHHGILKGRKDALLDVEHPWCLLLLRTHLADEAVVESKSEKILGKIHIEIRAFRVHIIIVLRLGFFVSQIVIVVVLFGLLGGIALVVIELVQRIVQLGIVDPQVALAGLWEENFQVGLQQEVRTIVAGSGELGAHSHRVLIFVELFAIIELSTFRITLRPSANPRIFEWIYK